MFEQIFSERQPKPENNVSFHEINLSNVLATQKIWDSFSVKNWI